MGVSGLQTFLQSESPSFRINIGKEIEKWKRFNNGQQPTIVIDFMNLAHPIVMRDMSDTICGGRHRKSLNAWKNMLSTLKSTGCKLVFFNDLNIPESKIPELLKRRNEAFKTFTKFYNLIEEGQNDLDTIVKQIGKKPLTTIFHEMASVAQEYGELHTSTENESDVELARYAKKHDVMAIVSDDSDFLIFDGLWRLWSASNMHFRQANQVYTTEINPDDLKYFLSLSSEQLPLFATLCGNDLTQPLNGKLNDFFGSKTRKFENVARFVRDMAPDYDTQRIVKEIFGTIDNDTMKLIESSVNSYDTDDQVSTIGDPIAEMLLDSKLYRSYMKIMAPIQARGMPFYDLRCCVSEMNLPCVLIDWIKRKKGIVMNTNEDKSYTFILIVRKDVKVEFMPYEETPIYPDFSVPPLDELYLETENDGEHLNKIRWKLLGWIMSFDDGIIAAIQHLPKKFLLISTTLCVLVKNRLISTKSADGILYTEHRISKNETAIVSYPTFLIAEYVRAAHIYNIAFSAVRENFTIAGLLPVIQDVMQFDGVYFQRLMERMPKWCDTDREILFEPIQKYRIYA